MANRMGDSFETFLQSELQKHGLTRQDLAAWDPPVNSHRRGLGGGDLSTGQGNGVHSWAIRIRGWPTWMVIAACCCFSAGVLYIDEQDQKICIVIGGLLFGSEGTKNPRRPLINGY